MNRIILFEDFVLNNEESSLITYDDIVECIKKNGLIYTQIINNYPGNDPEVGIRPLSIDNDGLITVDIDDEVRTVYLENVNKIEY